MAVRWDGRAHLSKALWIGLAVDERGNEVGEAFAASMRVGFCTVVGLGGPSVFGGDLSRASFGQAGDIAISRSARDCRVQVLSAVSVLVRCLHLHITAVRTCNALLSKMSVLCSSLQSARPRWPIKLLSLSSEVATRFRMTPPCPQALGSNDDN